MKITELKPLEQNPFKSKGDDQIKKIAASIESFSKMMEIRKIVIDETNTILGGNKRYFACKTLGMKDIPGNWIEQRTDLTEAEKREFIVKDNAHWGSEWDVEMLKDWDVPIEDWGVDVDWPAEEIEAKEDGFEIPNEIETDIVLGDVFQIGEHRLMCGDSTDSDSVAKLMDGEKVDMVFTSPPYNGNTSIAVNWNNSKELYNDNNTDNKTSEEYIKFNKDIFNTFLLFCKEDANIFYNINYNKKSRHEYILIIKNAIDAGFNLYETICWKKTGIPNAAAQVMTRSWEFIFLLNRGDKYRTNKEWHGYSNNYWEISNNNANSDNHKACFPIGLPAKGIEDFTKLNELLYDPFLGSGSTMVAAHQLKRKCYGMELDPKYCQVIIDRMKALDPNITVIKL